MSAFWSLKSAWRSWAQGWNWFFHHPCDARVCAAIRIVYATLVLIHLAVLYPDLERWFTGEGLLPYEASRDTRSAHAWTLFAWLPDTLPGARTAFWIAVAHAAALLVGLLPRVNAFFLFLWIVSFQVRNSIIHDGEDNLMRLMGFFMIWLPSGRCWSVNAIISHWWTRTRSASERRPDVPRADCQPPGWPLRLLQIEMAAMLFSSGLIKLSGEAWSNGTAMYYVSRLPDFFGRLPVPAWLFDTPWGVKATTWSVLAAELMVPLLIWFRETRPVCLVVLLVFHLANEWTMNLFLFHWLMLCGWIAFVQPEDFSWLGFERSNVESRKSKVGSATM
jgi:hypothetical protein